LSSPEGGTGRRPLLGSAPKPVAATRARPPTELAMPGHEAGAPPPQLGVPTEEPEVELPLKVPIRRVRLSVDVERVGESSPPSSQSAPQAGPRGPPRTCMSATQHSVGPGAHGNAGDETTKSSISGKGGATPSTPCLLPGVCTRRVRLSLPAFGDSSPSSPTEASFPGAAHEAPVPVEVGHAVVLYVSGSQVPYDTDDARPRPGRLQVHR